MKKLIPKVWSTEAGLIMLSTATLISLLISICNLDVKPVAIAFIFPFLVGGVYYVFAEALGNSREVPKSAIDYSTGEAAK
ncbi:MAG: hypothetical protein EOO85_29010 [Pedobacter sp.]|nr:MAG: hypothetical protein EOO85_29010 [Pedobacter sp.]